MEIQTNDGKKQKIIVAVIVSVLVLLLAGAGIIIASNQPVSIEQSTEEHSKNGSDNNSSDEKEVKETGKDNSDSSTASNDDASSSHTNSSSFLTDDAKNSINDLTNALRPSLTAEEVDNKSYMEQDDDYTKVDDYWKYKNVGNYTEFVRISDNYSFKVDTKMSPTYTLAPHYKPNLEFATNASEQLHFSINVSNDWNEAKSSVDTRKETLTRHDGNNCSYAIGDYTVMYWYSAKASTDSFYTSDYIEIWNETKQFYMKIYCDNYSGEETARKYTDLFEF